MRLISMTLENFKGVRSFTLTPDGRDISVYGQNASGKTTLADAFWWLLFGKSSSGATDFNLLPLDSAGKRVEGITEASVEAVLDAGGKPVTLRKVYREVWTKKRGRPSPEYTGNTTDCFIDGVPTKAGEYATFIKRLADEEQFKLVSNPRYFNELLDWKKRRQVVMGLDGQITDADVFGLDPELFALSEQLKGRTVDDYRKVLDAEIKKTNQDLDKLPVRIDEAQRGIPEAVPLPGELAELRKRRMELASSLASTDAGGLIASKVKALREIEGQIVDLDNKHRTNASKETTNAQGAVDVAKTAIRAAQRELDDLGSSAKKLMAEIEEHEGKLQVLANAWENAHEETFAHEDITTCYACGQSLPEAAVRSSHDRALAVFNRAKASEIEQIEQAGQSKQETLKATREKLAQVQRQIEDGFKLIEKGKQNLTAAENRLTAVTSTTPTTSPDPLRHQLADQQLGLQAEIEELKRGAVDPAKDKLAAEIADIDSLIAETEKAIANNERREQLLARIEQLKAQQKDLGKTYESLEHQRELCERFVVAKAEMLTSKVNGQFKLAKFRLFERQINGGISDTCEVTVDGVPYSDLNNGMRLNVGLDVIDTLSEVYGVRAPVFLDNREALSSVVPIQSQLISLVVSAGDKALRIEKEEKE